MSKISIYEVVPVPKLADKLVGTSVGGDPEDITYNFTLSELLNLFIPNIPGNTLQGVLDFGNTATQDIILNGTIFTTYLEVTDTATILDSFLTGETHITGGLYDRLNSVGTAGQVLRSTGTQVEWYSVPTVIPDLQQVLTSGNTAVNNIILTGNLSANNAALLTSTISTSLTLLGTLRDGLSSVGANNQVLSSNVSGVRWVNLPVYSATSPLLYNSGTGVFSIQQANASQNGYLSSADWITFDGKQTSISLTTTGNSGASTLVGATINVPNYTLSGLGGVPQTRTLTINGVTYNLSADRSWTLATGVSSVSATTPLFSTGGVNPDISIQQSSSSLDGYLSNVDWLTFNSKQPAGNYITSLTGEATAAGPGAASVTLSNAAVIGKLLTGLSITGSAISSSDSILTAFGKVQNQINGLIGGVQFQGVWNAATNTPALVSSVGTQGYYYIVDVAGNTNLNGITDWQVGDWAIFNGSTWNKVDNTDLVTSVNGQVGAVSLTTDNIPEGATNLYYLDSRARAALSFAAGSGAYNSTTGVITIPTDNSQILNGAGYITLVSLSATSPLSYNNTTGAFAIQVANTTQDGYLSSTDWNTFNGKQPFLGGTGLVKSVAGVISYITDNSANWNTAYNDSIVSAAVTGTATKTLTLNQQDGGTITASWSDIDTGLTSVGVSMPSAFTVTNSPLTSNGTIAVTGSGNTLQYVDGTGALQTFPSLTGYVPYTGATANVNLGIYNLTAASLIKNGGTSGQFLKADGSVDSSAYIVLGSLSATAPLSYNNTTGVFTISQSGASTNGYLSSTDWNTFNNKQATLSLTTTGSSGAATLISNTLNIPDYGSALSGYVTLATAQTITGAKTFNDYQVFTNAITANSGIAFLNGVMPPITSSYYSGIGGNSQGISIVTRPVFTNYTNNLYFAASDNSFTFPAASGTIALVGGSGVGTVTSVSFTLGSSGTDLNSSVTNSTTTPAITLNVPTASAANRGALSAADWSTFNTKVGGVTATTPLFSSGGSTPNLTIQQSSGSQAGYLSSTDWTTFNNKQAAGNYITSLTGEATATGPGAAAVTLDNAAVTGKILTGVNITGGTILSTDSILTGFGKLQNQVNGLIGGSIYQGTWNANTNTPTLTSSVGTAGYYYIVSVAGNTNLNGITDWQVGDWAIFNGGVWQKVDNTDSVISVNGQTGAVSLTTDNISEGVTNLYFTNTRARAALSFVAGSGAYNSSTGAITIPTNTSQLTNGANFITLASLSGTAPISYNSGTGAISITQSGTASNGYLSSTDWNTFNNKQPAGNYVPYTGANANVDLGIYFLKTSKVYNTYDWLQEKNFGYSASWKTLAIGSLSSANDFSLAFGVDLSGNPGSSFTGNGSEYFWRNSGSFKTPNAANTEYNTLLSWNTVGEMTFNQSATFQGYVRVNNAAYDVNYVLNVNGKGYIASTPNAGGAILYLRDSSATGANTTFGGLFLGSAPGNDFTVGKKTTNSTGSFEIRVNGTTTVMAIADTGVTTLSNLAGTGSRMVVADANGLLSTQAIPSGTVTGTGTPNKVAKWGTTTGIVDSYITDAAGTATTIIKDGSSITAALLSISPTTGTNASILNLDNSGAGSFYIGRQNSAGGSALMSGLGAYASVIGHTGVQAFNIITSSLSRITVLGTGEVGLGCTPSTDFSLDIRNLSSVSNNVLVNIKNTSASEDVGLIIDGNSGGTQYPYRIGLNVIENSSTLTFSSAQVGTAYKWFLNSASKMYLDENSLFLNAVTDPNIGDASTVVKLVINGDQHFPRQGAKIYFGDVTAAQPLSIGEGFQADGGTDADFMSIYHRNKLVILGDNNSGVNYPTRVGIGKTVPGYTLDISKDNSVYNRTVSFWSGTYMSGWLFSDLNGGITYDAGNNILNLFANWATDGTVTIQTKGTTKVAVLGSGNLIVGDGVTDDGADYRIQSKGSILVKGVVNSNYYFYSATYASATSTIRAQYAANWQSSNNWGIGAKGASDSTVYIGNTSAGVIDPAGTFTLAVLGTIDLTGNITTTASSSTAYGIISGIQFKNSANSGNVKAKIVSINGADSDDMGLSFQTSTNSTNVSEKLRIVGNGNVGIGTSPGTKLDVLVSSGNKIQFGTTVVGSTGEYVGGLYYTSNKLLIESFLVGTGYQPILIAPNGGNIGIRTTTPVTTNLNGSLTIVKSYNGDIPTSTTAQTYDINQSNLYLFGRNAGLTMVGNPNEECIIAYGNAYAYYTAGIRYGTGSGVAGGDMVFQTGGTNERMRISNSGTIGIIGNLTVSYLPTFSTLGNISEAITLTMSIPASSSFTSGGTWAASTYTSILTWQGSSSINTGAVTAGFISVNRHSFSTASSTITVSQAGTGIRTIAGLQVLQQTGGTINGTISHGASLFVQGVYPTNTANVTFTNYYGLLINNLTEWGGVTIGSRYGIYQAGTSDTNYFAAQIIAQGTNGALSVGGSGYTLNPTNMLLGKYTSGRSYIQVPDGTGQIEFWDGGTSQFLVAKASSVYSYTPIYSTYTKSMATINGGTQTVRIIEDDALGQWILVGRFAANAMSTIQGTWSTVSGLNTGFAQDIATAFSADFGDAYPTEVRIMGATDFSIWKETRTVDFVYRVPAGRQWKTFFNGGNSDGTFICSVVARYGWDCAGTYDGFGRWNNPNNVEIGMSDGAYTNPSTAYTTPSANAINWNTTSDAKMSVIHTGAYSGQDVNTTSAFGADDAVTGFFDVYPTTSSNMAAGNVYSSAVWILIKLN